MTPTMACSKALSIQSAVGAEGKSMTREASIFPENPANVTDDCVEATHDGLFKSVVQSGVGATGKFVTRDAGSEPAKFSSNIEVWVGADVALIQPAICPLLAGLSRSSLKDPVNTCPPKIID